MQHWTAAKRLSPKLPVLDADMGKHGCMLKGDPQRALQAFREGVTNDPANAEIYAGLDEAMSLTGVSGERTCRSAWALSVALLTCLREPGLSACPDARGSRPISRRPWRLFEDRFFPSEEGGVNAAQVLFEIKLMQAEAEAASGKCTEGERRFLRPTTPGLAVNGAVSQADMRMAAIAKTCQHPQQAEQLLQQGGCQQKQEPMPRGSTGRKSYLAHTTRHSDSQKLQASLVSAERVKDTSAYTGWWWYNIGTMRAALHRKDEAKQAFNNALLLPDSMMSHHLARAALADMESSK